MMRKALAALLLSMLVLVGAPAAASAGDRDDSCAKYSYSKCEPAYPPKPPKPDKPHKPPTHKPSTPTTSKPSTPTTSSKSTTTASPALARTGADSSVPLLAVGGGLIVVGAAAYGVSRLRRQN